MRARIMLVSWLHGLIAAFQFLTRLPIPVQITYTDQVFRRSVVFYPLVGAVIGVILSVVGEGLRLLLPAFPASVIWLSVWVIVTGGLHLDGLMDTADGILSHRSREKMLEIMKDSRVGAMGVIVCVLHLLMKLSLLYALLDSSEGSWRLGSVLLVLIPLWSRWFMAAAIYRWPYARSESGIGSLFQSVTFTHAAGSAAVGLLTGWLVLLVLLPGHAGLAGSLSAVPVWGVAAAAGVAALAAGMIMAGYISRKLGGLTGDTYGAINELLESVLLLAVVLVVI